MCARFIGLIVADDDLDHLQVRFGQEVIFTSQELHRGI